MKFVTVCNFNITLRAAEREGNGILTPAIISRAVELSYGAFYEF